MLPDRRARGVAPPCPRTGAAWVVIVGAVWEASQIREIGRGSAGGADNPIGDARKMTGHGRPFGAPRGRGSQPTTSIYARRLMPVQMF